MNKATAPQSSNGDSLKTNDVLALSQITEIRGCFDTLKKIMGDKKDRLQELIRDCIKVGKLEYKLTIDGKHVNSDAILYRVHRYQDIYEQDFRRLVMSINAMEKLYSELAAGNTVKKVVATAKVCGFNRPSQTNPTAIPSSESSEKSGFDLNSTKQDESEILSQQTLQENLKNYSRRPKQGFVTPLKASNCHSPSPASKRKLISYSPRSSVRSSPKSVRFSTRPTSTTKTSESMLRSPETPKKDPKDNRYHCKICEKPFLKAHSLLVHMEFDHPSSLELSNGDARRDLKMERTRKCQWCDKTFRSNVSYSLHLKEHKLPSTRKLNFSEHNYALTHKSPKPDSQAGNEITQKGRSKKVSRPFQRERSDSGTSSCEEEIFPALFHENFFDPEIPFESSINNPIIPIVPLSEEIVKEYLSYRS